MYFIVVYISHYSRHFFLPIRNMLSIFTSSNAFVMKNSIEITLNKGCLTFALEEASIYELNNLPVVERMFLQHYFDLIREGYQDYVDGTNTLDAPTYLVKALMQHIARIVRE